MVNSATITLRVGLLYSEVVNGYLGRIKLCCPWVSISVALESFSYAIVSYEVVIEINYIFYLFRPKKSPTLVNSWSCAYLVLSVIEGGPALGLHARCSLTRVRTLACKSLRLVWASFSHSMIGVIPNQTKFWASKNLIKCLCRVLFHFYIKLD